MFNKPKGLTPENVAKALLQAPSRPVEPIRPEKVARAIPPPPEPKARPNFLGIAQQLVAQGSPSAPLSRLERDILELARDRGGMLTCAQVHKALQTSRADAQAGLDRLANRGLARRVGGRHEVVYLFEQYLAKPAPRGGVPITSIFSAAVWVYGRWTEYQQSQARQEQQLLDLAYNNHGWFTHAEAVHVLGKAAPACIQRLTVARLVQARPAANGQLWYVVEQFLPPTVVCAYCDSAHAAQDAAACCCNCGAALEAVTPTKT